MEFQFYFLLSSDVNLQTSFRQARKSLVGTRQPQNIKRMPLGKNSFSVSRLYTLMDFQLFSVSVSVRTLWENISQKQAVLTEYQSRYGYGYSLSREHQKCFRKKKQDSYRNVYSTESGNSSFLKIAGYGRLMANGD